MILTYHSSRLSNYGLGIPEYRIPKPVLFGSGQKVADEIGQCYEDRNGETLS